jgi:hypothetical protein
MKLQPQVEIIGQADAPRKSEYKWYAWEKEWNKSITTKFAPSTKEFVCFWACTHTNQQERMTGHPFNFTFYQYVWNWEEERKWEGKG